MSRAWLIIHVFITMLLNKTYPFHCQKAQKLKCYFLYIIPIVFFSVTFFLSCTHSDTQNTIEHSHILLLLTNVHTVLRLIRHAIINMSTFYHYKSIERWTIRARYWTYTNWAYHYQRQYDYWIYNSLEKVLLLCTLPPAPQYILPICVNQNLYIIN